MANLFTLLSTNISFFFSGTKWVKVGGLNVKIIHVSVGYSGVWCTAVSGEVFYREGTRAKSGKGIF